ncbi:MAG TPA: NAD(P)-binding domain-containing protein [Blastocatellia bacterium]|nr:NAD(P)-binding domain-containing protein [Blastocatellia bacterium]
MSVKSTAAKSKFIIKRKDQEVDNVYLESEGLTIGRLTGNDLVLNHRAVSRTHAGIKEFKGEYWIFNLSESNGTLLNGELVDKTSLVDGDVLQIGPYTLQVNYIEDSLGITVEMEIEVNPLQPGTTKLLWDAGAEDSSTKTVLIQMPSIAKKKSVVTPSGARRVQGTGLMTSVLAPVDEQALNVFWGKRKREAGKLAPQTLLHPRGNKQVGKAQFNWRPTLDLSRIWRKSYFYWGIALVVLLSIAAFLIYEDAYSPGEITRIHQSTAPPTRANAIALRANENSCSNCHGVTQGMQDKCISCHQTDTFRAVVFDKHYNANIGCVGCHTEHQGESSEFGLLSNQLCANCHNGTYTVQAGEKAGTVLPVAHGGDIGYPVENGKWKWMLDANQLRIRRLPETWAGAGWDANRQFHAIHQMGRMNGKMSCKDCHTAGTRGDAVFRRTPRDECAKCHNVTFTGQTTELAQANCYTCHRQHGSSPDLVRLLEEGKDEKRLKDYVDKVEKGIIDNPERLGTARLFTGVGGASEIRQQKDVLRANLDTNVGALPWYGWAAMVALVPVAGLIVMAVGTARRKYLLDSAKADATMNPEAARALSMVLDVKKLEAEGPSYPHPVVNPLTCIGCHACVEACPHDVLAIVNGISVPVAPDQCMEDTSCQVECPTNPKSCVVINTKKVIPKRKVPERDQRFKTNVEGIYLIGDVSGVPLIKNAINEGAAVIDSIQEDIQREGPNPKAEYDVAVIGIGPGGLSAAVIAKQRGLSYIAIEQDKVVATIQQVYPAGKFVFYKPDTVETKGGIPLPGAGGSKEEMLKGWLDSMRSNNVVINEEESCKDIKQEDGLFFVTTEKGKVKEKATYKARKVIIAIGNRGTPMKLGVKGENIMTVVTPEPQLAKFCPTCGSSRKGAQKFCVACGAQIPLKTQPPYETGKVQYKLTDPDDYVGKNCVVVGAGNSSIEAAVDLTGLKRDGERITFTRNNNVTLVVRSDFKGDLKLGNKMNVYDCIDAGKIKVFFRTEIKEITETEVVLMDVRSKEEKARIPNDFVFALIGGEKPTKFLEAIGIKVG